jgi:hypothetical protein
MFYMTKVGTYNLLLLNFFSTLQSVQGTFILALV